MLKCSFAMNELGAKGEELAVLYLRQNGFKIRFTNWQYGHKEIDIIAEKGDTIHFVEVKARSQYYLDEPKQAVVRRKQNNIILAADGFMQKYSESREASFDIIGIVFFKDHHELEFIENAFEPNF